MKHKSFESMNCSLAQTLEVIGERWTLLILREIFFGTRRFEQLQKNLGIARNILTARLGRLVEEDILLRRPVAGGRHEYVLTDAGFDLQPVLLAMTHWGDRHRPNPRGDRLVFIERGTGRPIERMSVRSHDGQRLSPEQIKAVPGPGLQQTEDQSPPS